MLPPEINQVVKKQWQPGSGERRSSNRLLRVAPEPSITAATRCRLSRPPLNGLRTVAIDHPEIAGIDQKRHALAQNDGPGAQVQRIDQADRSSHNAEIPEGDGDDAVALAARWTATGSGNASRIGPEPAKPMATQKRIRIGETAIQIPVRQQVHLRVPLHNSSVPAGPRCRRDQPAHPPEDHARSPRAARNWCIWRRPVRPGAMAHRQKGDALAFPPHQGDEKAVLVIEIGQRQIGIAAKSLEAAAGVGGAVLAAASCESRCPACEARRRLAVSWRLTRTPD